MARRPRPLSGSHYRLPALDGRLTNPRSDQPPSDRYGQQPPPGATPSPSAVANSPDPADSHDANQHPYLHLSASAPMTNPTDIPFPTTPSPHLQDLRPTSSCAPPRTNENNAPSSNPILNDAQPRPRLRRSPRFLPPHAPPRAVRDPPKRRTQHRRYSQLSARQVPSTQRSSRVVCRPSHRAWCGSWNGSRRCWAPSPMSKADSAAAAAVVALMVMGTTAEAVTRPCVLGRGGTGG